MALAPDAVRNLVSLLARQPNLGHIKVRKHGDSLVLFSEAAGSRSNHARLSALGGGMWGLSLAMFGGRWERTPFVGKMDEVADVLLGSFSGYLEA